MIDAAWLRSLGSEQLEQVLHRRPDSLGAPEPESLTELAARLITPWSVVAAMRRLDRPTLQVAEALAAIGGSASRADLARLLGGPEPRHLDRAISTLREHALLTTRPQPTLVAAAAQAWPDPLHLGPPAERSLHHRTVQQLKDLARALGLKTGTKRADVLREVASALRDPKLVRDLVAKAPKHVRDELVHSALTGEPIDITGFYSYSPDRRSTSVAADRWGIERGLLVRSDLGDGLVLVAEVALALRGPGYHAPFEPDMPPVATVEADQRMVDSAGLAAAAAFANTMIALLDEAGRKPFAVLKAGGIGTRELKRLAKVTKASELEVRLALSLGYHMELWEVDEAGGAPTSHYDRWLAASPADRLADVMRAAWRMPQIPFGEEGTWHPIDIDQVADLRARIIRGVPAGAAIVDPGALAAATAWRYPYGVGDPAAARHFIDAAWREAEVIGIVAVCAVTSAGRVLLDGGADLEEALAGVGLAETTARFGADLTAVVTGSPSADLARLLDCAADQESRGTASTWRFSRASVLRALDAGHTIATLLERLSEVAASGVPQPLEYLVRDVARQHGAVRVSAVVSCLRGEDPELLRRLVADRKLAGLKLRLLAPTVVASSQPVDDTLAALRSAGYAPVPEDDDGAMIVRRPRPVRAEAAPRRAGAAAPAAVSPAEMAKKLLAAPDVSPRPASGTLDVVETHSRHLSEVEMRILAHAVDVGGTVIITYVNQQGNETIRPIEDIEIAGGSLYAWCRLRDDARYFNLGRILSVRPA